MIGTVEDFPCVTGFYSHNISRQNDDDTILWMTKLRCKKQKKKRNPAQDSMANKVTGCALHLCPAVLLRTIMSN
jgi:hypothetical protein